MASPALLLDHGWFIDINKSNLHLTSTIMGHTDTCTLDYFQDKIIGVVVYWCLRNLSVITNTVLEHLVEGYQPTDLMISGYRILPIF